MAKAEKIEWSDQETRGRKAEYPWDEWLDGEARRIVQGTHFDSTVRSMSEYIRKIASTRRLKVRMKTSKSEGWIEFQALKLKKKKSR